MNKNYLFPHRFQIVGWVLAIAVVAAFIVTQIWFPNLSFKMPAIFYDGVYEFFDDEPSRHGFFVMATTRPLTLIFSILTIGLIFIGFSKEKVEDEFVSHIREQSLVWATYVTAVLFILATLTIYGGIYAIVPYFVFFVFLLLFIVKFRIELYRFKKGVEQ
ncbi:MAG: hypothetical protein IJ622_09830 [Bacteroidales bacterium]|nr:hypothetical protein [Bacteroidales bacterium]